MRFKKKNETGNVYGRLRVLESAGQDRYGAYLWRCKCECGTIIVTRGTRLRANKVISCGCYQREVAGKTLSRVMKKHGLSKHNLYWTWRSMLARCNNPSATGYEHYGGRGIEVCESWSHFTNFLKDVGERPEGKTLDRIDVDGNYEPGNVRWATAEEQNQNKRR